MDNNNSFNDSVGGSCHNLRRSKSFDFKVIDGQSSDELPFAYSENVGLKAQSEALVAHNRHLFQESQKDRISNSMINDKLVLLEQELAEAKNEIEILRRISQDTSKWFATVLNVAVEEGVAGNEYRRGFLDKDCLMVDAIQSQVMQNFVEKTRETRKSERNRLLVLQGEREVEKAILVRAGIYRGDDRRAKMLSM
jgi:hypothetical protein